VGFRLGGVARILPSKPREPFRLPRAGGRSAARKRMTVYIRVTLERQSAAVLSAFEAAVRHCHES